MQVLKRIGARLAKVGYLIRATCWAAVLGVIELVQNERGRRILAVLSLGALAGGFVWMRPIRTINPGEVGVRVNRVTGHIAQLHEGWALVLPGVHELRRFPLRDQIYRPTGERGSYQSAEGLNIGVDVAVRYALDPGHVVTVAEELPTDVGRELVEPLVDGVLHRVFAQHSVREIFATERAEIGKSIEDELRPQLLPDGIVLRNVFIGHVDLPEDYRNGLESLLTDELAAKSAALTADADKIKREKAAEAAGQEEIIAAKAKEEAMQHVLPWKQKEIEQRRLEAEAAKVTRLEQAQAEAEARRIEAAGEADSRRKLADADAYRIDSTGKASAEQMAREAALIQKNPLLIQKTLADKLSDKISVIIAPPGNKFVAGGILGGTAATDGKKADASSDGDE